jgi:hypothetical protein
MCAMCLPHMLVVALCEENVDDLTLVENLITCVRRIAWYYDRC